MIFACVRLCFLGWIIYGGPLLCVEPGDMFSDNFQPWHPGVYSAPLATTTQGVPDDGSFYTYPYMANDLCDIWWLDEQEYIPPQETSQEFSTDLSQQQKASFPLTHMGFSAKNSETSANYPVRARSMRRKRVQRGAKINIRARKLIQRLESSYHNNSSTRFEDLSKDLYTSKEVFQQSILRLMYYDMDIRERNAGYYCTGQLDTVITPTVHVAVAMIKLLNQGPLLPFDVKFQLYRQGYRSYAPEHLGDIEKAIIVAGLHPHNPKVYWHGSVDFCEKIKEIWEKVKDLSEHDLRQYLWRPPEEYLTILKDRHYEGVVRCLWELREDGIMDAHESAQPSTRVIVDDHQETSALNKPATRTNRKALILNVFRQNKGREICITDLPQMADLPSYEIQGPSTIIASIMPVVLEEPWIIYNKEDKTIKLMYHDVPKCQPRKNTNLLTMVYDLIQKYRTSLMKEEIAYFADREGYWTSGFRKGNQKLFYKSVNWYKAALSIMGYIGVVYCPRGWGNPKRRTEMWPFMQKEDSLQDLAYYRQHFSYITQDDLEVMRKLKELLKSAEFAVFINHWEKLNKANQPDLYTEETIGPPPAKCRKV